MIRRFKALALKADHFRNGVKNGKTQQEQMFSALWPTADIVSEAVRIRGEAANRSFRERALQPFI
jgi:hypothetical protein